jgi:hypothetical protein
LQAGFRYENNTDLCGAGLPTLRPCTPADLIDPDRQQPFSASISPQATSPNGGGRGRGPSTKALAAVAVVAVALLVLAATTVELFALSWRRWRGQRVVAGGSPSTAGGGGRQPWRASSTPTPGTCSPARGAVEPAWGSAPRPLPPPRRTCLIAQSLRISKEEVECHERKKMMLTGGAHMSLRGSANTMRCTSSYTPAARPRSSSYVFRGIFERSQKL